jgi:suppressor of fused
MMNAEESAPGWDAIDAAIRPLIGDTQPRHWGTPTVMLPDQDGLWGISAYRRPDHWFFVTYGLSELFVKVREDPDVSGWGEELTMRLALGDTNEPPQWGARLLSRLGQLVYERGIPYEAGGRQEFQAALPPIPPVVCFTADPELPLAIDTPHGRLEFVAVVPISTETLEAMRQASTAQVLDELRGRNPLLIGGGLGLTW